MKHTFKRVSVAAALLSCSVIMADSCSTSSKTRVGGPFLYTRSQSLNLARQNAGLHDKINLCNEECLHGVFGVTFEYSQSFRSGRLAQQLLGSESFTTTTSTTGCNTDCATLRVQGTAVANRLSNAWLAENFGLGNDADTSITLKPRSRTFLVDFDLYLGLDEWMEGLYFRAYAPVAHVRNELRPTETVNVADANGLVAGYFNGQVAAGAAVDVPQANLLSKATEYLSGNSVPTIAGVTWDKLAFSKWAACKTDKTALADLRMELGYNFWCCEDYHVGLGLLVAAPTGNRPKACNFFEPIVGNGRHWEVGGAFHSHATLWRCEESDSYLNLEVDANITTLLRARQTRTFDLKNGVNSRYMVAAEHVAVVGGGATPNPAAGTSTQLVTATPAIVAPFVFNNRYQAVANLTTQDVDVKIGVQADVVAKLVYSYCNWDFGIGYNLWATSCEKFKDRKNCGSRLTGNWALKGDAFAYGFGAAANAAGELGAVPVALAFSESKATIYAGTNVVNGVLVGVNLNPNIDNKALAFTFDGAITAQVVNPFGSATDDATNTFNTRFSNAPIFIKSTDIDRQGNKALSHKVFGHIDYSWPAEEDCNWGFFLGLGGEGEFGDTTTGKDCNNNVTTTTSTCNASCRRSTLSQWGVWIKGGVTF